LNIKDAYYVEILKRLREAVHRKGPKLWPNDWILHHDNAPSHKALSVQQFLAQKWITEMDHPPFSPDMARNGFWLFPEIKFTLKGRKLKAIKDSRGKGKDKVIPVLH
jgi:histone-lysine N-methyltransferase SETMAR